MALPVAGPSRCCSRPEAACMGLHAAALPGMPLKLFKALSAGPQATEGGACAADIMLNQQAAVSFLQAMPHWMP